MKPLYDNLNIIVKDSWNWMNNEKK